MTRFWDGRTDRRSDPTPRPAFAFGDAGKNASLRILSAKFGWMPPEVVLVKIVENVNFNKMDEKRDTGE